MKKNNKGYMLIEIIMAFVLAFVIIFFITELVINLKNKNDDILVLSKVKTEQAIIYNKLNTLLQNPDIEFKCEKLNIKDNILTYDGEIITSISDYINLTNDNINCIDYENNDDKFININIDMNVLQLEDENLDINLQYISKKDSNYFGCGDSNNLPVKFSYHEGKCEIVTDDDGIWKIRFLTSGYLEMGKNINSDIFIVGGGGGGSSAGAGGGGGYTSTYNMIRIEKGIYRIVIGNGGNVNKNGDKSYFNDENVYYANGGGAGNGVNGGNGGSGGGAKGCTYCASSNPDCGFFGCCFGYRKSTNGAKLGNSAMNPVGDCFIGSNGKGGKGQGITTCEFGLGTTFSCDNNIPSYSQGGNNNVNISNSGNGGNPSSSGSSGIVILKNRPYTNIMVGNEILGSYSGEIEQINEDNGNWKVKLLTSGQLKLNKKITLDLFLVGGGGGGSSDGAGGGGGYTATYKKVELYPKTYQVNIGAGGGVSQNGGKTYFDTNNKYYANGGYGANGFNGGNGGSGGGAKGCGYCASSNPDCGLFGCCVEYRKSTNGAKLGNSALNPTGSCDVYSNGIGGSGQGITTCEFGLGTTSACNTGITGYSQGGLGTTSAKNTGNGGNKNSYGDSGIVVIRNSR